MRCVIYVTLMDLKAETSVAFRLWLQQQRIRAYNEQLLKSMYVFIYHHIISLDTLVRLRLKNGTMKQRGGLQNGTLWENKWS